MLRQLAQETGGRAFFPARIEDLAGVYAQIADELSSQYTLGYIVEEHPARRRLAAHRRPRRPRRSVTARTKQGYFAARRDR